MSPASKPYRGLFSVNANPCLEPVNLPIPRAGRQFHILWDPSHKKILPMQHIKTNSDGMGYNILVLLLLVDSRGPETKALPMSRN